MKKGILNIIFLFILCTVALAHSGKAKYHVIVDMDNSTSSKNALTITLANNEVEVLAVLASSPEVQNTAKRLMKGFYHDGIPVFEMSNKEKAANILKEIFENEPDSVTYLGLSGLENIALLTDFNVDELRLLRAIIFNDGKKQKAKKNKKALKFLSDNNICVDLISGQAELTSWDFELSNNLYHEEITRQYEKNGNQILLERELIPLFLRDNSNFVLQNSNENFSCTHYKLESAKVDIANLLTNALRLDFSNENKVFSVFPQDKTLFTEDVQQIMDESMVEHGYSEWRACVITNELHGHLGIYAVVGAKMGIRVREYFRVGVDDIHITTFAGTTPPFSCLNDGLQVSTGGTLGHGLIKVDEAAKTKPAANFSFKNHKVYMELKPEYWEQIKKDIRYGVKTYGLGSEKYWAYVRKLALKYWHDWDRHHIFIMN